MRIGKKIVKQQARRPRGRPTSINRTDILELATNAFWRLGYDGASLGELTKATGVSRPTLYAAFGDKNALFDAAFDHYAQTIGAAPVDAFVNATDIRVAVTAFLTISAEGNTKKDGPSGCFIACCAAMTAEMQPSIRAKLLKQDEELTAILSMRFAKEVSRGVLTEQPTPEARAVLLGDLMRAQAVRARSGASRAEILSDLPTRIEAVLR